MDPLDLLTEADSDIPGEYATPPEVRNLLRAITQAHRALTLPSWPEEPEDDAERADINADRVHDATNILAAALREYGIEPHTPPT